jgi:hypothetical protein
MIRSERKKRFKKNDALKGVTINEKHRIKPIPPAK